MWEPNGNTTAAFERLLRCRLWVAQAFVSRPHSAQSCRWSKPQRVIVPRPVLISLSIARPLSLVSRFSETYANRVKVDTLGNTTNGTRSAVIFPHLAQQNGKTGGLLQ